MLTIPVDRPTVTTAPPAFCRACDGAGRVLSESCAYCDGTGLATCGTCKAVGRVADAGEGYACDACIERLAWECDRCAGDPVTIAANVAEGLALLCARHREPVKPAACCKCNGRLERGEASRDDKGRAWCSECVATAGDCCLCVATGIGAHEGVGCSGCGGSGEIKAPRWREEE